MSGIYSKEELEGAIRQQELLSNLKTLSVAIPKDASKSSAITVGSLTLPFAIVISQDCDLDSDFINRFVTDKANPDKLIPEIIVCAAWLESSKLPEGHKFEHEMSFLKSNRHDRLYWLEKVSEQDDLLGEGTTEDLIVDFKKIYSIPTDYLYYQLKNEESAKRRTRLDSPYKEHFASKCYQWLGRVGLPEPYKSTK